MVMQGQEATARAPVAAPALAAFGVGGEVAVSLGGGTGVVGQEVGFEQGVKAGLVRGAQGAEALGPDHFQVGSDGAERGAGAALDVLEEDHGDAVETVCPEVPLEGGAGGSREGCGGGCVGMASKALPAASAGLADVDRDGLADAGGGVPQHGVDDPLGLRVGGEGGVERQAEVREAEVQDSPHGGIVDAVVSEGATTGG